MWLENVFFCFPTVQVDVRTKRGEIVAASLWMKDVDDNKRLAVLEPVERAVGEVFIFTLVSVDGKCQESV